MTNYNRRNMRRRKKPLSKEKVNNLTNSGKKIEMSKLIFWILSGMVLVVLLFSMVLFIVSSLLPKSVLSCSTTFFTSVILPSTGSSAFWISSREAPEPLPSPLPRPHRQPGSQRYLHQTVEDHQRHPQISRRPSFPGS